MAVILSISWSIFIFISTVWNIAQHRQEIDNLIVQMGRVAIERDSLFRQWNSSLGGLYARVTEKTKPNVYLTPQIVRLRDLSFSPEDIFTLINPAHMTRQIYELAQMQNKISGHMVGLKPINPQNKADSWETKALNAMAQEEKEYVEFFKNDGHGTMRMLLPQKAEKACLKCHASQGYKEGDIVGGSSTVVSLEPFHVADRQHHNSMLIAALAIWFVGLIGIYCGYAALAQREFARVEAEKHITILAHFDTLTGLVNRNLFHDRFKHALVMAERHRKKVCLLYLDLDRFKPINDNLGHEAGDHVLREVAKRLLDSVRKSDTVARLGGDEFVVIMQEVDEKQDAVPVAQKIHETMGHPFVVKGKECLLGASIGISCFPDDGADVDTLMRKADATMYKVKGHSHGGFEFS